MDVVRGRLEGGAVVGQDDERELDPRLLVGRERRLVRPLLLGRRREGSARLAEGLEGRRRRRRDREEGLGDPKLETGERWSLEGQEGTHFAMYWTCATMGT